jgi:hypothetical protein
MPIGSESVYVNARIGASTLTGMTCDEDILILTPNAPLKPIYFNGAGWDESKTRCGCVDRERLLYPEMVPVPDDFSTDPGYIIGYKRMCPNHSGAILLADGVTVIQNQPLHVCGKGGVVTSQYIYPSYNIRTGSGIEGAHGGSGMASLGGSIRVGELLPGSVIRHALKINLFARKYLYYNIHSPTPGYRWPAVKTDGYAGDPTSPAAYGGQRPSLTVGSLLALKPDFDLARLHRDPARIIAQALMDYGGYVVDDVASDSYGLSAEWGPAGRVLDEFQQAWGFSMDVAPTIFDTGSSPEHVWARDMAEIFTHLHVINNNAPDRIGGGGTPRQPLAPPFE